jgi:hypothetical protein
MLLAMLAWMIATLTVKLKIVIQMTNATKVALPLECFLMLLALTAWMIAMLTEKLSISTTKFNVTKIALTMECF